MGVTGFLQKVAAEQSLGHRQRALDLELARLDQLQAAFYPAALAGDVAAGTLVLKFIARRSAMMGFDKIDDRVGHSRTVVITGSSEDYIAGLRSVIDQASAVNRGDKQARLPERGACGDQAGQQMRSRERPGRLTVGERRSGGVVRRLRGTRRAQAGWALDGWHRVRDAGSRRRRLVLDRATVVAVVARGGGGGA
jgi:hypothetical protein